MWRRIGPIIKIRSPNMMFFDQMQRSFAMTEEITDCRLANQEIIRQAKRTGFLPELLRKDGMRFVRNDVVALPAQVKSQHP